MMGTQDSLINKSKTRHIPGGKWTVRFLYTLLHVGLLSGKKPMPDHVSLSEISNFIRKHYKKGILLVGSNPSSKSPDNSAFHHETKSRRFVDKWFEEGGWDVCYENLVNFKTEKNKQLSTVQIKENLDWIVENMTAYNKLGYKIVACGKIATKGLTMAKIDHFEMPHPSGLCRFWNDKEAGETKVKEMKRWILDQG